jgi:hypothetical protein
MLCSAEPLKSSVSGSNLITLLFWNIAKNPACLEHLPCLARTHEVDVFILAECPGDVNLDELNVLGNGRYQLELNANAKIQAITRLDLRAFTHRYTSVGREMAVWSTVLPVRLLNSWLSAYICHPSLVAQQKLT